MRYFSNFPKLITSDGKGNVNLSTNLLARVNLVPNLLNNPSLFYKYNLQDGDTPEIIASKYYDNPYRYWIFLYGNNISIWQIYSPSICLNYILSYRPSTSVAVVICHN